MGQQGRTMFRRKKLMRGLPDFETRQPKTADPVRPRVYLDFRMIETSSSPAPSFTNSIEGSTSGVK